MVELGIQLTENEGNVIKLEQTEFGVGVHGHQTVSIFSLSKLN